MAARAATANAPPAPECRNLAPIPEDVSGEAAVYTCDMMSTGFAGAEHAAIPIGGSVAIFAEGPSG